jgi:hypothetical protein
VVWQFGFQTAHEKLKPKTWLPRPYALSKAWERWLSHLRDLQGYTQPTIYSYGKGISYEGGKIDNPAKQSALVCIKRRGTTYG